MCRTMEKREERREKYNKFICAMFIDTRVHVTVRPVLEYKIPEVGKVVVSYVLGDTTFEEAESAYLSIEKEVEDISVNSLSTGEESISSEVGSELLPKSSLVCGLVEEYLEAITSSWCEYVQRMSMGVRREVGSISTSLEDAKKEVERVTQLCNTEKEREKVRKIYRETVFDTKVRLESCVCAYRDSPPPQIERSQSLINGISDLKGSVSSLSGRVRSKDLVSFRNEFETSMASIQVKVASRFLGVVRKILKKETF